MCWAFCNKINLKVSLSYKLLKMKKAILLLIIVFTLFTCKESYTNQWETFDTELILKEKSFQEYEEFVDQKGDFKLVNYASDNLILKALLNTSQIDNSEKKPVIVYLHGGFALSYNQVEITKPFTDKGFIVFAPTFRGENGNPGNFELFMGEVRDAKAAINWIAEQPYVDKDRIYVFGWSVGGGIALNLTLHDDLPIKLSASSAGLYDLNLIKQWATKDDMIKFPYDYKNEKENHFRLPLYHLENMVITHHTYIGSNDNFKYYNNLVDSLYSKNQTNMRMNELQGDHMSSVPKAMRKFMNEIRKIEKLN